MVRYCNIVRVLGAALMVGLTTCGRADPVQVKAEAIRRADTLVQEGQHAQAVVEYQRAVEIDPRDGELRLKLSTALESSGQWLEAVRNAVASADMLPDRVDVQIRAARLDTLLGRFADGKARIETVLRKEPANPEALVVWANATARVAYEYWALTKLTEITRRDEFERVRTRLRGAVSESDDIAAEAAFKRAMNLRPDDGALRIAYVNFLWATDRLPDSEPLLADLGSRLKGYTLIQHALGQLYLMRGDTAKAEEYLKDAAQSEGGERARLQLAQLYVDSGRYTEVVELLGGAVPGDEVDDEWRLIALAEFGLGRRAEALKRIDQVIARKPQDAEAQRIKAEFLLEMGRAQEAVPFARAAVAGAPDSVDARFVLGRVLYETGDEDAAFKEYLEAARVNPNVPTVYAELTRAARATGRHQDAVAFGRDAIRRLPDDRQVRLQLATALTDAGDFLGAEKELKPLLTQNWAPAVAQMGALHAARGNAVAARAALLRALEIAPLMEEALTGLVSLEIAAKRPAAAREIAMGALAARPADPVLLMLAASAHHAEKSFRESEQLLRRILQSNPAHSDATVRLATVLSEQGRHQDATAVLKKFVEHYPNDVSAQTALGRMLENAGQRSDAIRAYERALEGPRSLTAASRLATLYLEEGRDLERALELATRVRTQQPDDAAINDVIGSIHMKMNFPWRALAFFEQAVQGEPSNAHYRYSLGFAYLKEREIGRGQRELRRALELDPRAPQASEARMALGDVRR